MDVGSGLIIFLDIKRMVKNGVRRKVIMNKYNISRANIYLISSNKRWSNVKLEEEVLAC